MFGFLTKLASFKVVTKPFENVFAVQAVEKKEREDELAGINKPLKGAKGGGRAEKQKKNLKQETAPSAIGERVVPQIDAAYRAKAEAAATKKKKAQVRRK